VRSFSIFLIVSSLIFLVACGGGGTPAGVAITMSVSANPTTLNPGQSSTLTATLTNTSNTSVTWSIVSPSSSFGSLTSTTTNPTTYKAPTSVSQTTVVTIMATSAASSSVTATVQITVQSSSGTISLSPAAPQTVNLNGTLPVTATLNNTSNNSVTWSLASGSVGTLSNQAATSVTYNATAVGSATLTATSGSATQSLAITVLTSGAGSNVAGISVGSGPAPYPNGVFTSVLICPPGSTTNCQTVNGILVDTGSFGLRILGQAIPNLALTPVTYSDGSQMNECVQFVDGTFIWGPISTATISIGGETASGVPVQVIANSPFEPPSTCGPASSNPITPQELNGNGILGVGPEPFDCGLTCDVNGGLPLSELPALYYASCGSSSGCQVVYASCGAECNDSTPLQQVTNPVITFATDNNGTLISMAAPAGGVAPTASGTLTFGIGTQSNNGLTAATILPVPSEVDEFTTVFEGQTLLTSFIDSGSNGLFFPNWPGLTICSDNPSFYCPGSATALSAINEAGSVESTVNFTVDNADTLLASGDFAVNNLAGPAQAGSSPATCVNGNPPTGDCTFDFGFPFFYGQTIFTAIDGQSVPATAPAAPWFAY